MQYTTRKIFFQDDQNEEQIVRPKNFSLLMKKLSILCLTTFYFGYCLVYITALSDLTIIHVFGPQFNQPYVKGLLVGCLTLGAMVGSIIAIPLVPLFSRRNLTLFICIIAIILQGVIQAPYAVSLFICRSLQGVCSGIFLQLIPLYINQLSPKQIAGKGILGVMANAFVIIGVLTSFGLNIILIISQLSEYIRWRVIFAVNFVSIFIVTICIVIGYIPQSPNSLIQKKQQQKAKQVIGMFHKKRYIDEVYLQRQRQIAQSKIPKQQIKSPSLIRKILAFELPMMQQLTGINAFVSQMGGVASAYQIYFGLFVPAIMASVHVMGALYSMTCLTRAKRKTMILTGNILMGICSLGIGILFIYINQFNSGFWIVVALTFIYMTTHGATLIPAVWLYVGEIVSDNTPKYSSITNWFMCSVTIVIFPIINQNYGFAPMFITFGVISLLLAIFNMIFMFQTNVRVKDQKSFELQ